MEYLPTLLALAISVITLWVNYKLGVIKNSTEGKATTISAETALRDDLFNLVKEYDAKQEKQDQKIEALQAQTEVLRQKIYTLDKENLELRLAKVKLENRVKELETDLAVFERRVYYVPEKKKDSV